MVVLEVGLSQGGLQAWGDSWCRAYGKLWVTEVVGRSGALCRLRGPSSSPAVLHAALSNSLLLVGVFSINPSGKSLSVLNALTFINDLM